MPETQPGPAAGDTVLVQRWLGLKPFVLVVLDGERGEHFDTDENDYNIKITMEYGGGVGRSGAFGVMAEMLEQNGWQTTPPNGFDPDAED